MMDMTRFKALLNAKHHWPGDYTFKFICSSAHIEKLSALFATLAGGGKKEFKQSAQGNYVSLTVTLRMDSSDSVIELYQKASALVPGLISL